MQHDGRVWYDYHMEAATIGNLLVADCDTVGWSHHLKVEFKIEEGQALLLLGARALPQSLNHMLVFDVVHPRYGRMECLACDLKMIENT